MDDAQTARSDSDVDMLVARIAAGDAAAEISFVERYQRKVTILVRRHCRPNEPQVPDIVQEVLTAVLLRLRKGELRDARALPGYVQVTVTRMTAAEYRRQANAPTALPDEQLPEMADDSIDPGARLDEARRARAVRHMLGQLRVSRDRELLERFYLREESKEEVCAALAIDADHFHRVHFRARERFGALLNNSPATLGDGETDAPRRIPDKSSIALDLRGRHD